ncbi:MAG: hypothetical protein LIO37_01560 [Clostridiales bacterium]|nr:hypothetical protein [Clostridiales bacterium]
MRILRNGPIGPGHACRYGFVRAFGMIVLCLGFLLGTVLSDADCVNAATSSAESADIYEVPDTEEADSAVEVNSSSASSTNKKIVTANTKFTTSVSIGINGYAISDTPTIVQVTVSCTEDFTGSIRLVPNTEYSSYMTSVAYEQDIVLAAGEAKLFTFYPSEIGDNGKIKISILNSRGNEVYAETDVVTLVYSYSNLIIGVLSDDFAALNYMNGLYVASDAVWGYTKLMELNESNFPEKSSVLAMMNVIIIDNYDTAKLSDEQYDALKEWVQSGGILILGLGANYQNVLHIFDDDFLTGTIGSLESCDVTWPKLPSIDVTSANDVQTNTVTYSRTAVLVGETYTKSASLSDVDCLNFTLDGGSALGVFADGGIVSYKDDGAGTIVVVGYDLAMEPVASYDEKEAMAYALLMAAGNSDFSASFVTADDYCENAEDIAGASDNTKRPNVRILLIILGIYVIVVGPVLYLILKAIGKREKIWIAVPGTAAVFTLVIYLFTLSYQIGGPIVNTFSIVELDGDVQNEMVYTSVTCPSASEYELLLSENYTNLQYNPYNYDYDNLLWYFGVDVASSLEYNYLLKETNEGLKVMLENDTVFNETVFAVTRTTENTAGSLALDLTGYTVGFTGTVTNNTLYDMDAVVVTFENYYCRVGALKAGESADITLDDLLTADGYGNAFNYYYKDSSSDEYTQEMVNYVMYYYYTDRTEHNGCAWGYVSDYVVDVCADSSIDESGSGVFYTTFTADYDDVVGAYYSKISSLGYTSAGEYDTEDGWMYDQVVEVTYQFGTDDNIVTLINRDYTTEEVGSAYSSSTYYYYSEPYAQVYIYNYETGDYEQIFTDSMYFTPDDMGKYIDENGLVMLRYFIDDYTYNEYGYAYIPEISALGGESDAAN